MSNLMNNTNSNNNNNNLKVITPTPVPTPILTPTPALILDNDKPVESNESSNLNVSSASQNKEQQERKKIILGRGYSLMDWIRYSKETPDLAGTKGILRPITYEELAKHNKEDDCWMAVYDKVYNVTPYMKYHPGGVDELMRGAGKNATDLFNEVHQWVNIQSMLEKCLVGPLLPQVKVEPKSKEPVKPVKSIEETQSSNSLNKYTSSEIPVLDSYQSNYTCNIVLYTKCKNLTNECLIIDKSVDSNNPNFVTLFLYTPNGVYRYILEIPAPIQDNYDIKTSKEGKIDLTLHKIELIHWWQMCPKLKFKAEIVTDSSSGVNFRDCELVKRVKTTHDTSLYYFDLPSSSQMRVPIGHHIFLRLKEDKMLVKPYTVLHDSLLPNEINQNEGKQICLMIKHYEKGALTSKLKNLEIGSKVEISNYTGSFNFDTILDCSELYLICAGTGFTPMTRILTSSLNLENLGKIRMLFFNKTSEDILWEKELEEIEKKYNKFRIYNILSEPGSNWSGKKGKISSEILKEFVSKNLSNPLFLICGPRQFTDLAKELIQKHGYSEKKIIPFLS